MQIGIKCNKTLCFMRDSAYSRHIVKNSKIFWSYEKHFRILPCDKTKNLDWSMQISFHESPSCISSLGQ